MSLIIMDINDETIPIVDVGEVSRSNPSIISLTLNSVDVDYFKPVDSVVVELIGEPLDTSANSTNFFSEILPTDSIKIRLVEDEPLEFQSFPYTPPQEQTIPHGEKLHYEIQIDLTSLSDSVFNNYVNKSIYFRVQLIYEDSL